MYVYIRDDVTQNSLLIIPGMHWFNKNDQGTAGCRPDSPAIPSSSASCTSNCYRYVLSDMVDVGWVFLKMTPMLDSSLSLSLNMWYGKSASLKTMLLNNDMFGSSMTYAYEFSIFQKTHPCRSTKLVWFGVPYFLHYTSLQFSHERKTTTTPTCFTLLFCQTEKMSGGRWAAGPTWLEGSNVIQEKLESWLHLTELRWKNQTKTPKKQDINILWIWSWYELIRSISSAANLLHHTSPTSTPRTFCVSNNVTRRQRWAALVSFRPLFKVSWDVNPKNTGSIQHLSIGLLIGKTGTMFRVPWCANGTTLSGLVYAFPSLC